MKISELIIRLEAEKRIYGDICVATETGTKTESMLFEVTSIEFLGETFMRKDGKCWRRGLTEGVIVLE